MLREFCQLLPMVSLQTSRARGAHLLFKLLAWGNHSLAAVFLMVRGRAGSTTLSRTMACNGDGFMIMLVLKRTPTL